MATYSFENVQATIAGPGGTFSIGSGAGVHDEGISVERLEEKTLLTIGADGTPMHSLRSSKGARVTVRLLKTSPVNAQLSALYNFQQTGGGAAWGQNTLLVSDVQRGDLCSGSSVAFAREPNITWSKDGAPMNEWIFLAGIWNNILGVGIPDVNT
jgi:structural protein KPP10_ORF10